MAQSVFTNFGRDCGNRFAIVVQYAFLVRHAQFSQEQGLRGASTIGFVHNPLAFMHKTLVVEQRPLRLLLFRHIFTLSILARH